MNKYQIPYINMIVRIFAERYKLHLSDAFAFLYKYGGIKFSVDYYEIEHTLPIEDTVDELYSICNEAGGVIS